MVPLSNNLGGNSKYGRWFKVWFYRMISISGRGGEGKMRFHDNISNDYLPLKAKESNSILIDSHILGLVKSLNFKFGLCVVLSIVIGIDNGIGII